MRQFNIIIFIWLFIQFSTGQSIGIGTSLPHASAALDVSSTSKGLLIPRMTAIQRDALVGPAIGLNIYNIDEQCTNIFNGVDWDKNCDTKTTSTTIIPANTWIKKSDRGGEARNEAVAFSIGNKGYIGTGVDGDFGGTAKKNFWEYDPAINVWTQKADFGGVARWAAVGFSIGDKGYIGTGWNGIDPYLRDFWEYNPDYNIWTQKADFGGTARSSAIGFSMVGKGYIGTGDDNSVGYKNDFWEYNPNTNAWIQKANFAGSARYTAVGFSIGAKGYIGTGSDGQLKNDFWEYNPISNIWTQKENFGGTNRRYATGFSLGNRGYIGTGNDGVNKNDFWEYEPLSNAWTQKEIFGGAARERATSFAIGNKGYIGTGHYSPGSVRDIWQYNPVPDTLHTYVASLPNSITQYKDHDWTSIGNKLFNSKSDVDISVRGKFIDDVLFKDSITFGSSSNNKSLVLWDNSSTSTTNYFGFSHDPSGYRKLRYQVPASVDKHTFFAGSNELLSIKGSGEMTFPNYFVDKKIILREEGLGDHEFYGMGINNSTFRFQIPDGSSAFKFYAGTSDTTSNLLMTIDGFYGELFITGQAWKLNAGNWAAPSDERVKKNVYDYTVGLNEILKIRPVTFQYNGQGNTKADGKEYVGVIAQEIESILPSTVSNLVNNTIDNLRSFDGSELTYTLINAVKKMNSDLEEIEGNNKVLSALLKDLKSKIK